MFHVVPVAFMVEYINLMKIHLLLNKNARKCAFFDKNGTKLTSQSDKIDNDIPLTTGIIGKWHPQEVQFCPWAFGPRAELDFLSGVIFQWCPSQGYIISTIKILLCIITCCYSSPFENNPGIYRKDLPLLGWLHNATLQ